MSLASTLHGTVLPPRPETDPNYIFIYDTFREGVWSYLGGAQYRLGRFEAARQSLERALAVYRDDHLAKIYLGLTLARLSRHPQGMEEVQTGLSDLYRWFEYMQSLRPYTSFWDPLRQIRSEIQKALDLIAAERIDWPKLIDTSEWVARQMEEEIERVRRDARRLRDRDLGPRSGVGVGFGF